MLFYKGICSCFCPEEFWALYFKGSNLIKFWNPADFSIFVYLLCKDAYWVASKNVCKQNSVVPKAIIPRLLKTERLFAEIG